MSIVKLASAVSAMFAAVEGDSEDSIKQRVRFYKTVEGITFPDGWDELPLEERKKRLDEIDQFGLGIQ